jgi:hypothetical protein
MTSALREPLIRGCISCSLDEGMHVPLRNGNGFISRELINMYHFPLSSGSKCYRRMGIMNYFGLLARTSIGPIAWTENSEITIT